MTSLEEYYNKFNEDKRLKSRHGQVEYNTTMAYIKAYLNPMENPKIADIGAATGAYTVSLALDGYEVTAIEPVKYNLGILKKNYEAAKAENPGIAAIEAMQGNALNLKKLKSESFDLTLLFGPLYHLHSREDKLKALSEAKRITKPGGIIMVAYVLCDYSLIAYAIKEGVFLNEYKAGNITPGFSIKENSEELYDYVRIADIDSLNAASGLAREKIISPDGPTDYIRQQVKEMDDESFSLYMQYVLSRAEDETTVGAGSHVVDILRK